MMTERTTLCIDEIKRMCKVMKTKYTRMNYSIKMLQRLLAMMICTDMYQYPANNLMERDKNRIVDYKNHTLFCVLRLYTIE